jgi:hypothetical protein
MYVNFRFSFSSQQFHNLCISGTHKLFSRWGGGGLKRHVHLAFRLDSSFYVEEFRVPKGRNLQYSYVKLTAAGRLQ